MTKTLLIRVLSSAVLFAGLIGFGAGMKTDALVRPPIGADRVPIRRMAIESQGHQGSYNTVIFGDSIVEFAAIDSVFGGRNLYAGVAGTRVEDLIQLAPAIAASVKPHTAIIAIGANDAARQFRTDAARFASSYRHLVDRWRRSTYR